MSGVGLSEKIISIHALAKRATYVLVPEYHKDHISIHALVKRATIYSTLYQCFYFYFNPRPREEGDLM